MNRIFFIKMSNGDIEGFKNLAFDFLSDMRRLMTGWGALIAAGNFGRLRDELHRCKGGASLFGLEELLGMITACERPMELEIQGFDLDTFEEEVTRSEEMILAIYQEECLVG